MNMNGLDQFRIEIDRYRETFEALASMAGEDASQIDFGLGTPKEQNQMLAEVARRFQEAMRPLENLRQSVEDALRNASGAE